MSDASSAEADYEPVFSVYYDAMRMERAPGRPPGRYWIWVPLNQRCDVTPSTPLPPRLHRPRVTRRYGTRRPCGDTENLPLPGILQGLLQGGGPPPNHPPGKNGFHKRGGPKFPTIGGKKVDGVFRLIIPVVFAPSTGEYIIPPDTPLSCFADVEWWIIEFLQRFTICADRDDRITFRPRAAHDPPDHAPPVDKRVVALKVQPFRTPDEARAYFNVFAPEAMPVAWMEGFLGGVEELMRRGEWKSSEGMGGRLVNGKRPRVHKEGDGEEAGEMSRILKMVIDARATVGLPVPQLTATLWDWAGRVYTEQEDQGKKFVLLVCLLRLCRANTGLTEPTRDTPLLNAVRARDYASMELLMEHGAEPLNRDADMKTALHVAARGGDLRALSLLLEKYPRVHVDPLDQNMRTPLMESAEKLSRETLRLLLEYGANPSARDQMNETVLHKLVRGGFDEEMALDLLEAGTPATPLNTKKDAPSDLAASIPLPYKLPSPVKKTTTVTLMPVHPNLTFGTAKQRTSQGTIQLNITDVERRPSFDYQFGLSIHADSEPFIELAPARQDKWPVLYCKCAGGVCNVRTCVCIKIANRGSAVFDARGRLLASHPEGRPILQCPAMCRCGAECPLKTLHDAVAPPMEIYYDKVKGLWLAKSKVELERGAFVSFLGGELVHARFVKKDKAHRYMLFSRGLLVDISRRANASRFFADSQRPNLTIRVVKEFDCRKPPQVAFFAAEWIGKDEPLTYDKTTFFDGITRALREYCFKDFRCEENDGLC
ncbi:histone-lysine N-methyltransferase EHMT1-like [Paramacrobiotus metropolitanus]|uniref:histone-lysine N-methyltransferase EHMT1-like n=1 Tax=Paramacrobiotus metropolitanus TaxID=2943436 RepID=UPI00244652C2|nr:histone-lysine N-methyltransferase EHMT1-like [Paramacrobiotus metropolitanus]